MIGIRSIGTLAKYTNPCLPTLAAFDMPMHTGASFSRRTYLCLMQACPPTAVLPEPSQLPPEVFFASQQSALAGGRSGALLNSIVLWHVSPHP